MNDKKIYTKTAAGQQEIVARSNGLDVRQRRLLILIDGQRNVGDLRGVSGFADAPAMLEALAGKGLVADTGGALQMAAAMAPAARPAAPAAAAAAPVDSPDWRETGRRAAHATSEMLGPLGEDLAMRMESAKSADTLDELLVRARTMVGQVRGKVALERFEQLLAEA